MQTGPVRQQQQMHPATHCTASPIACTHTAGGLSSGCGYLQRECVLLTRRCNVWPSTLQPRQGLGHRPGGDSPVLLVASTKLDGERCQRSKPGDPLNRTLKTRASHLCCVVACERERTRGALSGYGAHLADAAAAPALAFPHRYRSKTPNADIEAVLSGHAFAQVNGQQIAMDALQ